MSHSEIDDTRKLLIVKSNTEMPAAVLEWQQIPRRRKKVKGRR